MDKGADPTRQNIAKLRTLEAVKRKSRAAEEPKSRALNAGAPDRGSDKRFAVSQAPPPARLGRKRRAHAAHRRSAPSGSALPEGAPQSKGYGRLRLARPSAPSSSRPISWGAVQAAAGAMARQPLPNRSQLPVATEGRRCCKPLRNIGMNWSTSFSGLSCSTRCTARKRDFCRSGAIMAWGRRSIR